MSFIDKLDRARAILERQGRLSTRALGRELAVDGEELEELIEELVDVQLLARREGKVLVWSGAPSGPGTRDVTPRPRASEPTEARKVVSVVFADLIGSTALHEQLDAESVTRLMERYYRAMRGAIEAHGGTVVKLMGDGVMAAFGVPNVAEDDAIRAVRAGMTMQEAFRGLARTEFAAAGSIGLRVGINTGEVVVAAGNTDVVGDPVNVAARLQAEAHDGDVVIGEATRRLVAARVTLAPLGSFALKGRAEAIKAYRVESLDPGVATSVTAFVGRDEELARLMAVHEAATAAPATRLAVLLGSPGLGKSRLIEEVTHRLGDGASVVTAHCDAAGGATFTPVAAALREYFQIETDATTQAMQATIETAIPVGDAERGRIAGGIAALLAGSPASPEETFFVIRRLLAGLAATKPVVLVIDDLHWAEPLLLDLVEHLVQWGSGTPLFVLLGARPELRDLRSSLVTSGGLVSDVVTLSGLDAGAAMRLAANVIGAADLPAAVAAKVLATSEGNPLFVGELVRMLVDEGAIERQGERWIVGANLAALEMPPTIHALLAARIERLAPEDRAVLERAAVVGRHFSRSAVAALLGSNGNALNARLEALQRTELIERDTGWFLGEPMLRFHHVLIRDAAYRRLLKGTRAELHEQLANWIEAQVQDAPEHDETIGWHLEQAHQHRRELGPLDARGATLGERAANRLAAAGRRALTRDDLPVAAGLLGRALGRLTADDPARADLALDWCEALLASGDVGTAETALAELSRFAGSGAPRLAAWHTCFAGQRTVLTAPEALHTTADAVAAAAVELATLDDAAGEAKAHFVHALALARLGRVGGCEAALDKALAAARRAGDRRRANTVLAIAPLAALWGPSPVTRASGRCLDVVRVLRITQGAPAVESVALSCQAVLEALRGRTDAARRMLASSRKMVEDLGITQRLLEADVLGGLTDLLEGNATAAEGNLRRAYDGLRDLGLGIDAARAAALLARALLAQGRGAEAEGLSHESEALAGDDLKAAIAWRGVRAEALVQRGELTAAIELAQAAVSIASATDALLDHADARLALAAALRAAGRGSEADAEQRRALELWEAKGATVLVERTRRPDAPVVKPVTAPQPEKAPALRRRFAPNRATEALAPFNAAMAAPDFAAYRAQLSETFEEVDHQTGTSYGRDATVAALEHHMRSRDASVRLEPLATLGDALILSRRRVHASATGGGRFDVGEYEHDAYTVMEVDTFGRFCRHEVFSADHLDQARVRLYERYAALLSDGPERTRAAAAAQSLDIFRRWTTDPDPEVLPSAFAPDVEGVDHRHLSLHSLRGAAAYVENLRAWRQVADDLVFRECGILALEPHAMLVDILHTGTARDGGGAYERPFLSIVLIDSAGKIARVEWFDVDREAEALARFDELVAGAALPRAVRRRVTPNAATQTIDRFGAAIAARDLDALGHTLCESVETVHHQTGTTYDRKGFLATWRSMFRANTMIRQQQVVASLGGALALAHHTIALEGFVEDHLASVGTVEIDEVVLFEVDERGRTRRFEIFPTEKFAAAVALLYERHAALLPEGLERARAASTARSIAVWNGPIDVGGVAATTAASVECVDHRSLHLWSAHGVDEFLAQWRGQGDLATMNVRTDDVLALAPHIVLARQTYFGNDRATGGYFDHPLIGLFAFGPDGLLMRAEVWEPDRDAEALARFEELAAGVEPQRAVRRRVRPNAVTTWTTRFDAAVAARDVEAVAAMIHEEYREIDHPTGSDFGKGGAMVSTRGLFRSRDPFYENEPLATLGESLLLSHNRRGASGSTGGRYDVGPYEHDTIHIVEIGGHGLLWRLESFAANRLGDALVRLYERYAELLPEGAQRTRVAGIARSLAVSNGRVDVDRIRSTYDPSFQCVDHRVFGTWSAGDAEEMLQHYRLQLDLAPDFSGRIDDVFATSEETVVTRMTFYGTARDSGGPFENHITCVFRYGADGRMTCIDVFEAEQVAEAMACLDQAADWFENAAARTDRVLFERFNGRDWPGIEALAAPELMFDERRRMLHNTCGRDVWLEQFRVLYDVPASRFTTKLLGTRGERLSLSLHQFAGEVAGGGGPLQMDDHLVLHEVDAEGRLVAIVLFDLEDENAAWSELDARYDADAPPSQAGATATRIEHRRAWRARDWEAYAALLAPDLVCCDHRLLGWGTLSGAAAYARTQEVLCDLAPDALGQMRHLVTSANGYLQSTVISGTRDGGRFELPFVRVDEVDARGKICRIDLYDADRVDLARARFAELTSPAETVPRRFENAAFRAWRAVTDAWSARDVATYERLHPRPLRYRDHRRLFQLDLDRKAFLDFTRPLLTMRSGRGSLDLLATRGERLALMPFTMEMEDDTVGPSVIESLMLIEVDERGDIAAYDRWDIADIDAAYAELDARFEASEATLHWAAWEVAREFQRAIVRRDFPAVAALCAESLVEYDHRSLAVLGTTRGPEAWVQNFSALIELAPDTAYRIAHFRADTRGFYSHGAWHGTGGGGPFEIPLNAVIQLDEHGRIVQADIFDDEGIDASLARFAELTSPAEITPGRFDNAASRAWRAVNDAWTARNVARFESLHPRPLRYRDHRRLLQLDLDRTGFLDFTRPLLTMRAGRASLDLVATRGERLALMHSTMEMEDDTVGRSVIESLMLIEVDERGDIAVYDRWDMDDADAARVELDTRWAAHDTAEHPCASMGLPSTAATVALERYLAHLKAQDWNAIRASCASGYTWDDRRPIVGMSGDVELMIASARERVASGARLERSEIIGTAGDRIVVTRALWAGGPAGGRFEVEFLAVHEFDANGLQTALLFFDPSDPRAAQREAWARWAAIDPTVVEVTAGLGEWIDAWNVQDMERLRAALSEDLVMEDRRWTGLGHVEGREAYLRSVAALWELAPATRFDGGWFWLGIAPNAAVYPCRRSGTLSSGGEFVSDFLMITVMERGRVTRLESFEADAVDAALARFEALRPDPLRIPPNAAARAFDRWLDAISIRDEAAVMALCAPSYVIEDRRSLPRTSSERYTGTRTLLATAGDRLALHRTVWSRGEGNARSEIEALHVDEVDDDGRILWSLVLDASDRADAFVELGHRHLRATRPSALPRQDALKEARRSRDLTRMRAALPDDFVFHDHRRTGLGRLDGADAYVASVAALHELAPGATVGLPLHYLADEPHGTLSVSHSFGTLADGGAFESVYVMISLYGHDGLIAAELFELDDLEKAKARFAELGAAASA